MGGVGFDIRCLMLDVDVDVGLAGDYASDDGRSVRYGGQYY